MLSSPQAFVDKEALDDLATRLRRHYNDGVRDTLQRITFLLEFRSLSMTTARGWRVHHVAFGVALKKKMDELGIEADLKYPGAKTKYASNAAFFISKLK